MQLTSTDSTDSDVAPADQPIIVAARHDVIDGHLPLSWQRSPVLRDVTVQEAASRCADVVESRSCFVVKIEQRDSDDVLTAGDTPTCVDDMQPLDLTKRRLCDGTNTSSSSADAGLTASHVDTHILLLKGQRYEILPLGGGRWVSRSECELISALQNGSHRRPTPTDDDDHDDDEDHEHHWSVGTVNRRHVTASPADRRDDVGSKRYDDVNGNTCDVSTGDMREHSTVSL